MFETLLELLWPVFSDALWHPSSLLDNQQLDVLDRNFRFFHDTITEFLDRRDVVDTACHCPP
jgi:hypothetical protein